MKKIMTLKAALLIAVVTPASLYAETAPSSAGQDSRVTQLAFKDYEVYRINTTLRVITSVEFGRGENIESILVGDSTSFEVDRLDSGNVVAIKPLISGAQTNMTIYTNQNEYSFLLVEGGGAVSYRIKFTYPSSGTGAPTPTPDYDLQRDIAYRWSGDQNIRPVRVWNNGKNTFMEFDPSQPIPTVTSVDPADGTESTVNTTTKGSVVRITGIDYQYSIRIGERWAGVKRVEREISNDFSTNRYLAQIEFQGWR